MAGTELNPNEIQFIVQPTSTTLSSSESSSESDSERDSDIDSVATDKWFILFLIYSAMKFSNNSTYYKNLLLTLTKKKCSNESM